MLLRPPTSTLFPYTTLFRSDLPPRDVRAIAGPNRIVGFSTHNEAQLRAAADEPIDYVALGPIFGTASKNNPDPDRKSTRLNSSHGYISYAVFCLKKKNDTER